MGTYDGNIDELKKKKKKKKKGYERMYGLHNDGGVVAGDGVEMANIDGARKRKQRL